MAGAFVKLIDEFAENMKDKRMHAQTVRNEEIAYFQYGYIIFSVLNSGIPGVCPPADIQDILLPLNTRCIGSFAYNVTLERNINNTGIVNHAAQLTKFAIERELARTMNISLSDLRKILHVNVNGNTITVRKK